MSDDVRLQIKRTIKAQRPKVFAAWTKPELMQRWFAPGEMKVQSAEADVRVGGAYRVEMMGSNARGDCITPVVGGVYRQIIPDELLSFTWGWPGDGAPETLVTVEFKDAPGGTEVTLTHEGFRSAEVRGKHEHGWIGCLDNLGKALQGDAAVAVSPAQHALAQ